MSFVFAGAKVAYKVNYKGKKIATVSKKEVVKEAVKEVVEIVNEKGADVSLEEPDVVPVVSVDQKVDEQKVVVNAIIENTDEIVEASEVLVDGQKVMIADTRLVLELMDKYLDKFTIPDAKCETKFVQEIITQKGYFLKDELKSETEIKKFLSTLTVQTVAEKTELHDVPFGKVTQKDYSLAYGVTSTLMEGKLGKSSTVTKLFCLDGMVKNSEMISEEILIAPQDEVELLGQKPQVVLEEKITVIDGFENKLPGGFVFPLPDKSWRFGSPFGDNRNHKGVDLCANEGTAIMAAAGGKVIYSGWRGGYGNCVEIDHGNGITTRYGHAIALYVSKGDYVEAGQVIAGVGNTGDSYGNHLHFEILEKNKAINPAPYLGIK